MTRFFFYHLPRGGENVAADRAMEAAKLWGAKGLTMGFDTYVAITGSDLPLVLVAIQGKNLVIDGECLLWTGAGASMSRSGEQ